MLLKNNLEIILHLCFWVLYSCIRVFSHGEATGEYLYAFKFMLGALPLQIAFAYFHSYHLIPRYLLPKNYLPYLSFTLGALAIASLLIRLLNYSWMGEFIMGDVYKPGDFMGFKLIHYAVQTLSPALIVSAFYLINHYYKNQNKLKEFESEKLRAELKFLQYQMNPHFFLNTLNNTYGLALEKSERAPKILMGLSELMRYILYETDSQRVPLELELKSTKNLIALQQIRYDRPIEVSFYVSGDIENCSIPPVTIIPLVENAFKHGFKHSSDKNWLEIKVIKRDSLLEIEVSNSVNTLTKSNGKNQGIGLANIRKRLNILYGEDHRLVIDDGPKIFKVNIVLPATEVIEYEP